MCDVGQKTQQSPRLGLKVTPQLAHWWKYTQVSVGIVSDETYPHPGQVSCQT